MNNTSVWSDMISDATVNITATNNVTFNLTGYEKSRVSAWFIAKAVGTKLPPMAVFKTKTTLSMNSFTNSFKLFYQ